LEKGVCFPYVSTGENFIHRFYGKPIRINHGMAMENKTDFHREDQDSLI
jgi:hypothetical protein